MTPTQLKRSSVRLPCQFQAELQFSGGGTESVKKSAVIANISTAGIQILSPAFVATGQTVRASFKVPGQSAKSTFCAEVMRIESLQGRMPGNFPYALGAKFIAQETKQAKQIARFISDKVTCAAWRNAVAIFFFALGSIQLGRLALQLGFASSLAAQRDAMGFVSAEWLLNPFVLILVTSGLFSSALLTVFNHKAFWHWGFFWAGTATALSALGLYAKRELLEGTQAHQITWAREWVILVLGIGLILTLVRLGIKLKNIRQIISSDKAPAGRPTFTIV